MKSMNDCHDADEATHWTPLVNEDVKTGKMTYFDGFISYVQEDAVFAQILIKHLESNPHNLKLCVPERDLLAGQPELTAMAELIKSRCRKMLMVVSPAYLNSEMNIFHTRFAHSLSPEGTYWMFDCGEGSQIQLMKTSIRPGRISRIFISHLHGDHLFGLPGLLCTLSQNYRPEDDTVVHIYGPEGLRKFIRVSLGLSRSQLGFNFAVHELCAGEHPLPEMMKTWHIDDTSEGNPHPNEKPGAQILPDGPVWQVCEDEKHTVKAGWLTHQIPSFGFVIKEKPFLGKLNVEVLKKRGVPQGPLYSQIKKGKDITLPSGEVIKAAECVGPERPGRKVVILGDTSNSQEMLDMCKDADVLVHEATLENEKQEDAIRKGHSTPGMAGNFAKEANASWLIITHFSQRYNSSSDAGESNDGMDILVKQAQDAMKNTNVTAANDLQTFVIPLKKMN